MRRATRWRKCRKYSGPTGIPSTSSGYAGLRRPSRDLFGVEISVGSVQKAWEETAEAVASPYSELAAALPAEPVVNSDETGSWTNGEKRWVWALCTPWFVFYHIARSRGVAVLVHLLGEAPSRGER